MYYNYSRGDSLNIINNFITYSTNLILNGGLVIGIILIILESFLPILPLGVIVALITNAYGLFFGIIVSWISNCIGCYLVYSVFSNITEKLYNKILSKKIKEKVNLGIKKFNEISLPTLAAIIALPFTPSFLINILSGVSRINRKKYLVALTIGKIFMISFWAYIGKSFIESMSDLKTIITILVMLLMTYIISKIVSKKINIE